MNRLQPESRRLLCWAPQEQCPLEGTYPTSKSLHSRR